MSDIYLTWASNVTGDNFPEYNVYFSSVYKHSSYGKKVCLTNSLDEKFRPSGWEVIDVDCKMSHLLRDRHYAYWKYLCGCSPYDYVMISDSRDVLLQGNAIKHARMRPEGVILTGEGFTHRESIFNMADQLHAQQGVPEVPYFDWPVVNGGVILGLCGPVRNFCFLVWSTAMRSRVLGTDQGIINYLYHFLREDGNYFLSSPVDSDLCVTGEGVKYNFVPYSVSGGKICMSDGQPYLIFHQWERTEFREAVLQEYSANLILPPCEI